MGEGDLYWQRIAICYVCPSSNLNANMVRLGYALAYRQYPDAYVLFESIAKYDKAGMWSGDFVKPWEWRRRRKHEALRRRIDKALEDTEQDRI